MEWTNDQAERVFESLRTKINDHMHERLHRTIGPPVALERLKRAALDEIRPLRQQAVELVFKYARPVPNLGDRDVDYELWQHVREDLSSRG
jgi:hypothetical protein